MTSWCGRGLRIQSRSRRVTADRPSIRNGTLHEVTVDTSMLMGVTGKAMIWVDIELSKR